MGIHGIHSSPAGAGLSGQRPIRGVGHELGLQGPQSIPLVDEPLRGIILFGLLGDIEVPAPSWVCADPASYRQFEKIGDTD